MKLDARLIPINIITDELFSSKQSTSKIYVNKLEINGLNGEELDYLINHSKSEKRNYIVNELCIRTINDESGNCDIGILYSNLNANILNIHNSMMLNTEVNCLILNELPDKKMAWPKKMIHIKLISFENFKKSFQNIHSNDGFKIVVEMVLWSADDLLNLVDLIKEYNIEHVQLKGLTKIQDNFVQCLYELTIPRCVKTLRFTPIPNYWIFSAMTKKLVNIENLDVDISSCDDDIEIPLKYIFEYIVNRIQPKTLVVRYHKEQYNIFNNTNDTSVEIIPILLEK